MKILIVDDAGVMRKVISRELVDIGIAPEDIDEVTNGQEGLNKAVEQAKLKPYDLILMDWNMPELLGIDAVIAIRAANVQSPIVMVTTESERSNIVKAIQAGANNYLTKPFSKQDFQSKIQQVLGNGPYPSEADLAKALSVAEAPELTAELPGVEKKPAFNFTSGRLVLE